MKFSFAGFLCSLLVPSAVGLEDWVFGKLDVSLPKPLSDLSASLSPDGLVYLAGGCDDENGNVWSTFDWGKSFACFSISDAFFSFDPAESKFQELDSMPQARYRHSSAVFDNKVWIIGGRNVEDALIADIDVYDIATGTWSTIGQVPENFLVSDHASFANDAVYIAGGYNGDYSEAKTAVLKLNPVTFEFEATGSLNQGRGDIYGVTSDDGLTAYVVGGFHHSDWCSALDSVEEYSFDDNSWKYIAALDQARGESVPVEMNNHLYALGGEYPIKDVCDAGETIPGTKTVGTDRVEVLKDGASEWEILSNYPEERFRFAAVGVTEVGLIYSFGGQARYDPSCECFKTTAEIFTFGKKEATDPPAGDSDDSSGNQLSMFSSLLAAAIFFGLMHG